MQFDKRCVFDLHQSLLHREKMKVKNGTLACEQTFQERQIGEKEFPNCSIEKHGKCDSIFKRKQNLKEQIQSIYERKEPFKCNTCDRSFAQKRALNRHVASVHEGKKPYQCNICSTSFAQKNHLNGHVAYVHEGMKPLQMRNL